MKSHTEYLWFQTKTRREILHITPQVREILQRSGIREGLCLVSAMHITASVFVNDLESGLHADILKWCEQVFYGEWDGKRRKRVVVKILGE